MNSFHHERTWLELQDKFIPAHWQPAILLDLMLQHEFNSHKLLHGTSIFYDDLLDSQLCISAEQYFKFISNCRKLYPGTDLSFRYGQRLLPGTYSDYSYFLKHASSLHGAFQLLEKFGGILSPLLRPEYFIEQGRCGLIWRSGFGQTSEHVFICEAMLAATREFFRTQSGIQFPWRYELDYVEPSYMEQYEVNLGGSVSFSRAVTRMFVDSQFLHQPWPSGSDNVYLRGLQKHSSLSHQKSQDGFIYLVNKLILENIRHGIDLDWLAVELGLSPATLKRKLKRHHSQFRWLLDTARLETAVHLFKAEGFTNEQVASYLGFYDEANLRRSFKRWTGMSPSDFLSSLC
ncbi:putative HTH-type transcriptional regulator [Thalassocella blandensis]|nr:putative HTH-type transcriptional regulator [Thalassocella blandensis]